MIITASKMIVATGSGCFGTGCMKKNPTPIGISMGCLLKNFSPPAGENRLGLAIHRLVSLREGVWTSGQRTISNPHPATPRQQAAKVSQPSPVKGEGE